MADIADRYFAGRLASFPLFLADIDSKAPDITALPKGWSDCDFWHVGAGVTDDTMLKTLDIFAFRKGEAGLGAA